MVVAQSDIELIGWGVFKSENKMPEKVADEFIFQLNRRVRIVVVRTFIVRQAQFRQVVGCD